MDIVIRCRIHRRCVHLSHTNIICLHVIHFEMICPLRGIMLPAKRFLLMNWKQVFKLTKAGNYCFTTKGPEGDLFMLLKHKRAVNIPRFRWQMLHHISNRWQQNVLMPKNTHTLATLFSTEKWHSVLKNLYKVGGDRSTETIIWALKHHAELEGWST